METSELNKAHILGRRANKLVRKGLYADAVDCHLKAIEALDNLLKKLSVENRAFQSIKTQAEFHKSQANITEHVKEVAAKNKNWTKNLPKMSYHQQRVRFTPKSPMELQEIRRNFDEADSLLQILSERKVPAEDLLAKKENERPIEFTIRPKNEAEVIEELQTVNSNLRNHVDRLLNELQEVKSENLVLKKRLSKYESPSSTDFGKPDVKLLDASKTSSLPSNWDQNQTLASFQFKHSQVEELPPLRQLPELAALEEPDFDFSSIG